MAAVLPAQPTPSTRSTPSALPSFSRPAPARLSLAQKEEFEREGFLVIRGALNAAQVAHWLEVIDAMDAARRSAERLDAGAFVQIRNAVAKEPALLELIDWPAAFPLVAELMGPALQLNTSHAMVRPPQPAGTAATFKAIDWHRDGCAEVAPVHGTFPWIYTKIGYFLTDLSQPGRGNLRVVPRSHLRAERPAMATGGIDPEGALEVLSQPGDAVLFQQRLWHAVGPNLSPFTRKNIYFGYCYRWVKPLDYVAQSEELLARATPIQRQLLGECRSEMTFWLPQDDEVPLKPWLDRHIAATGETAKSVS